MTREEKIINLTKRCNNIDDCKNCPIYKDLYLFALCEKHAFTDLTDEKLNKFISVFENYYSKDAVFYANNKVVVKIEEQNDKIKTHGEICDKIKEIYKNKNSDYGNAFAILREKYPESIIIRLYDKILRLETLMKKDYIAKVNESIEDTLFDIANYAIMELTERKEGQK
jgi:hypothetical protein